MKQKYTDVFPRREPATYTYEISFTPLAKAFAEAKSSLAAVEEQVRRELDQLDSNPLDIFFHTVEMGAKYGDCTFIVIPRDGKMLIDTATYEQTDVLDSGPFKGKRVEIPRPDSE